MNISNRTHTLINKNGFELEINNVAKFARLNNLSAMSMYNLVNGVIKHYSGYKLKGEPSQEVAPIYRLKSPIGSSIVVSDMKRLCEDYQLSFGAIMEVVYGNAEYHRGWSLSFDSESITQDEDSAIKSELLKKAMLA